MQLLPLALGLMTLAIAACSGPETTASRSASDAAAVNPTAESVAEGAETNPSVARASAQPVQYFAENNVAIRGADLVAYFTESAYVPGSSEFTHEWQGVTWQFASAENRDAFAADPDAYAPEYGGFCAWAVSQGYTAEIDPEAWKIVEGKLYLNYSPGVQRRWARDIPGNIAKADQNWPGVLEQS